MGERIDGMPFEKYRAAPGISCTDLNRVEISYAHFLAKEAEDTEALTVGSALHCAILEPRDFESRYVMKPDGMSFATKEGKAWRESNVDRIILTPAQWTMVTGMQASVLQHPVASQVLSGAATEVSIFWTDSETGLPCKIRPDALRADGYTADIKSIVDARYHAFQGAVAKYRYYKRAAFYLDGIREAMSTPCTHYIFIVVEKSPPYAVCLYELDTFALDVGRRAYRLDLQKIKHHRDNPDDWPGFELRIQEMLLPTWVE